MKDYTYKEKEINLIRGMLDRPPKKIWWTFSCYIFDYDNYYLELKCVDKVADTQNESDEAVIATLTRKNEKFEPTKNTELVCQDKSIKSIYIVRTFLYFTTFRTYSPLEKFFMRSKQKLKNLLSFKKDPFGDLFSKSSGGCVEIICHPKSEEVNKINPDHANLLDVGLLIEIENKFLKAYLESNGYDFHIWDDKYFFDKDDLEEEIQFYEFINIENQEQLLLANHKE